jgi:hypothetical protein
LLSLWKTDDLGGGISIDPLGFVRRKMMAAKSKRFQITYHVDVELYANELWPDGDAPENPTVSDVRRLIHKSGGIYRVLDDWNLREGAYVGISEGKNDDG